MSADDRTEALDDGGFSLIELVVAGTLSLIVMAAGLTFFVNALRSTDDTTSSSINVGNVRNALDSWSSLIRVADSPTDAGTAADRFVGFSRPSNTLIFYANVGNRVDTADRTAPQKITLSVTRYSLKETREGTTTATRTLASCSTDAPACISGGSGTNENAFVPYYQTSNTCPTTEIVHGTLCARAIGDAPVVAVGISVTVTSPGGRQARAITTLVSVTGSSS